MDQSTSELFTEKYRPKMVKYIVLPERIKKVLPLEKDSQIFNYIFYGQPGSGKTTAAKAIIKQSNSRYLYINGSSENGIDIIRTKVTDFARERSIALDEDANPIKIVFIDEADMLTLNAFTALRSLIEQFAANTRFIFTCNYFNKIPEAITSRCRCINFDVDSKEREEIFGSYKKLVSLVCNKEQITISDENIDLLLNTFLPDMRKVYQCLNIVKANGSNEITENFIREYRDGIVDDDFIYDLCTNLELSDPEIYTKMIDKISDIDFVFKYLSTRFLDKVLNTHPELLSLLVLDIQTYSYQLSSSFDKMITLIACIFKIRQNYKKLN